MEKYLLELLEQENFDFNKSNNDEIEKMKNAIDKAWETRDFEIKLYWQRALYFWGFIALAFYAPFAILNLEQDFISYPIINKFFFVTIVCILGSFLSFAWYLANRGSKYWQENWERWIYILEKYKYGKLYSTTFDEKDIDTSIIGAGRYSLSRINIIISLIITIAWFLAAVFASINIIDTHNVCAPIITILIIGILDLFLYFNVR